MGTVARAPSGTNTKVSIRASLSTVSKGRTSQFHSSCDRPR